MREIGVHRHNSIRFKPEYALWQDSLFPMRLHHRGRWFLYPVEIHLVEEGEARRLIFNPEAFDYSELGLEGPVPHDLGFAGFRLMNSPESNADWLSFLGASYFRATGEEDQYGASARAVAINTALAEEEEEFPYFSRFGSSEPTRQPQDHRLCPPRGPAGAYRFNVRHERGVVMESNRLYRARCGVSAWRPRLHVLVRPARPSPAADWRPRIHDSDGLAI